MGQETAVQRQWYWDNAKALLIFLVVLGHCLSPVDTERSNGLYVLIYSFHMPLFVLIAGYFSRKAQQVLQAQRALGFLALALAMKLLKYGVYLLIGHTYDLHPFAGKDEPWYLMAMAVWLCAAFLLGNLRPRPKPWAVLLVLVLLGLAVGYEHSDMDALALMRVFVLFPFFYAGMVLPQHWMAVLRGKKRYRWLALAVLAGLMALMVWQGRWLTKSAGLLTARNSYAKIPGIPEGMGALFRLGYYVVVGLLCLCVLLLSAKRRLPLVTHVGAHTLQIFFWQTVLLPFVRLKLHGQPALVIRFWNLVPLPVFVLAAAALTLLLSAKPFSYPVRWIMNLPMLRSKVEKQQKEGAA